MIFKEDDNSIKPLIVVQKDDTNIKNIWFTLFDLEFNQLAKCMLINL